MSKIVAYIDGERSVFDWDDNEGSLITLETGEEFYIFRDSDEAGEEARRYWEDLAQYDPTEFTALVGEKTLVAWGLGQWAGPGSTQVTSLGDWLDLWLNIPEEHFASYDGHECEFECKHPDYSEFTVAYRVN
jgi:hypothetical protein